MRQLMFATVLWPTTLMTNCADIRRSGDINDTLIAQFSLIGRNNGTNLTASGAINPDASGNWIGGSVPGDAINPLLSPLSSNGGSTQTPRVVAG